MLDMEDKSNESWHVHFSANPGIINFKENESLLGYCVM
jgi:hypothetical protein